MPVLQLQPVLLKLLVAGYQNTTQNTDSPYRNFSHPTEKTYLSLEEITELLRFTFSTKLKERPFQPTKIIVATLKAPKHRETLLTFMNTHNFGVRPGLCDDLFQPEFLEKNPL